MPAGAVWFRSEAGFSMRRHRTRADGVLDNGMHGLDDDVAAHSEEWTLGQNDDLFTWSLMGASVDGPTASSVAPWFRGEVRT